MTLDELLYPVGSWIQRVYNRLWLRYMEIESEIWRRNLLNIREE
jgi:hypothetical protein